MNKAKKVFPIGTSIFWNQTVTGIFWLGAGLFGMFDNPVCNILTTLFLLAGIAALAMAFKIDRIGNDGDEMAEYNYTKAKANAGNTLYLLLCVASIISAVGFDLIQDLAINWPRFVSHLLFILIGVYNLLTGLFFRKLEAE